MEKAKITQKLAFHSANENGSHSHIWLEKTTCFFPPPRKSDLSSTITADFIWHKREQFAFKGFLAGNYVYFHILFLRRMTGQTDWAASAYVDNKLHTTGLCTLFSQRDQKVFQVRLFDAIHGKDISLYFLIAAETFSLKLLLWERAWMRSFEQTALWFLLATHAFL